MQLYNGNNLVQPIFKNGDRTDLPVLEQGSSPIYAFQYIMLKIYESWGDSTLQFSKMQFLNNKNKNFLYPSGCQTDSNGVTFFNGEDLVNVLINDTTSTTFGKACFHRNSTYPTPEDPIKLKFDLLTPCLNLKTYNRWVWYTSNDTADEVGIRNMKLFELFVSNTGNIYDDDEWISVDSTHKTHKLPSVIENYALAYTGNIKVY